MRDKQQVKIQVKNRLQEKHKEQKAGTERHDVHGNTDELANEQRKWTRNAVSSSSCIMFLLNVKHFFPLLNVLI